MDPHKDYKFYVVEFTDPPYKDFDKYVCILDTWIKLYDIQDQIVAIKYPIEKLSETKKRVKKREKHSENWKIFVASVKYGTDSYTDAKKYIKTHDNSFTQECSYAEESQPSTSGEKSHESGLDSSSEINKPKTPIPSLNHDAETAALIDTVSKQPLADTHKKTTKVNESTNAKGGKRYFTRQARKLTGSQSDEQISSTDDYMSDQNAVKLQKSEDKSDNYTEKSANLRESKENESSITNDFTELTEELSNIECHKPIFGADFLDLMQQLHSCLKINSDIDGFMQSEYVAQCGMVQGMMKVLEKFNDNSDVPFATALEELGARAKERHEKVERIEIESVSDVGKETKTEVVNQEKNKRKLQSYKGQDDEDIPFKKRVQPRKFTLPPEYNKNDSRWTLRYRKKKEGLTELVPHSGIYVNAKRLSNCKRLSRDSKTLAKMLLTEVFTENALSTCSLTGKKANAFKIEGLKIRPGLDKHARTVLLNFVEQYSKDNNWVKIDTQSVSSSLHYKINDMRKRHAKIGSF